MYDLGETLIMGPGHKTKNIFKKSDILGLTTNKVNEFV